MTNLARDEVLHRMNVFSEMGVFQNEFMKTASILSQKYSGDINIYPEIPYSHFLRILQNPTTEFIIRTCLKGEQATWPVISRVRNHLAIELALDSAVQTMRARVALSPLLQCRYQRHTMLNRKYYAKVINDPACFQGGARIVKLEAQEIRGIYLADDLLEIYARLTAPFLWN